MGDPAAWAAAIDALLDDGRRRGAMAALARQVAVARFSRAAMVAEVEQELLASGAA
jgi:glycosyltransferase involved in cell wall biosynthesis